MLGEIAFLIQCARFGPDDDRTAQLSEGLAQNAGAGTVFLGFENFNGLVGGVVFERPLIFGLVEPQRKFSLQLLASSAGLVFYGPERRFIILRELFNNKGWQQKPALGGLSHGFAAFRFLARGHPPRLHC